MFITPAYAQAAPGGSDFLISLMPFVLILLILYFLIIRPQQRRVKEHKDMVNALKRGDTVVTSGGIVGKVIKVIDDNEAQIELAENVRIRIVKQFVNEVRAKGEPAKTKGEPAKKESAATKS